MRIKIRSQESGVRSQESGVRSQESGVRSQESGVRSQESGVRSHFKMAAKLRFFGANIKFKILFINNLHAIKFEGKFLLIALCPLPFALCPLPFALCPLPFALCLLPLILHINCFRLSLANRPVFYFKKPHCLDQFTEFSVAVIAGVKFRGLLGNITSNRCKMCPSAFI